MITHYIYAIYYKNEPFYIGISVNPATRLFAHFKGISGRHKFNPNYKISILQRIVTRSNRMCKKCYAKEQYWINRFILEGHKLKNTAINKNYRICKSN